METAMSEEQPPEENHGFIKEYSEDGFWGKLVRFAKTAGKDVIEKALWLYYAAENPKTPTWAKTVIYGALGYFIFPVDSIPDIAPLVGYADDLGVLASAAAAVSLYINDDVKALTTQKLNDWFRKS
jgi:uncharacterized membrane protein YkvA (DUF1232 family)